MLIAYSRHNFFGRHALFQKSVDCSARWDDHMVYQVEESFKVYDPSSIDIIIVAC